MNPVEIKLASNEIVEDLSKYKDLVYYSVQICGMIPT